MCSLSTQFENLTYQSICALLHRCPGSSGHLWTRQVICQVLSAITVAHPFTAKCSLGSAAFSTVSINWPSVSRHVVQAEMQLQERTLNTAARFVNAVDSVQLWARTRQARLVLVQLAKQLKICAAGKAARLVHAVAYVAMRECTRRSRLVYWLVQQAKQLKELCSRQMQMQVWERKPFATAGYNQRFIYSVFTEDTLDEKGQARDTRVHVTL